MSAAIAETPEGVMSGKQFFGHPIGLMTLFFTELWERFSYYGMRALLVLYMTASHENGGLGYSNAQAALVYGTYTSAVYLLAMPGGWAADRLLGLKYAVFIGGIIIAAGHFTMAFESEVAFYTGLVLIVLGTGLLKPNISAIVGRLYRPEDQRRDAGFSIFTWASTSEPFSPRWPAAFWPNPTRGNAPLPAGAFNQVQAGTGALPPPASG